MRRDQGTEPQGKIAGLAQTFRPGGRALIMAGLCTAVINVLALTGPLYMLEVYSAALPSRNPAKLLVLTLAMLGLYALGGVIDVLRQRLLTHAAQRVELSLGEKAFAILHAAPLLQAARSDGLEPVRDLDQIRNFLCGHGPAALFDLPWIPLYLGAIFMLHPMLGLLATAGALLLVALMLLAALTSASPARRAALSARRRWSFAVSATRSAHAARAMGFTARLAHRWQAIDADHSKDQRSTALPTAVINSAIKTIRPVLQSAMLGLGAFLVISDSVSAASIFVASIILSRALAPVEGAIAHWRGFVAARQSLARLTAGLAARPYAPRSRSPLPCPRLNLRVERLSVTPPGSFSPLVHDVSFTLAAGAGLGIVGPSGSGKSTLARALVGIWRPDDPEQGAICLDGRPICLWEADDLGRHIGYVAQRIELLDGTIADNIARFDPRACQAKIAEAARAAGVHDLIERLPAGYMTEIGEGGVALSDGQRQRIALARALFGEPFLVVLDEANANLDAQGEKVLAKAIASVRARGGIVVVVTHRRSTLAGVDTVLVLGGGRVRAYGPKEAVLARAVERDPEATAVHEPARAL